MANLPDLCQTCSARKYGLVSCAAKQLDYSFLGFRDVVSAEHPILSNLFAKKQQDWDCKEWYYEAIINLDGGNRTEETAII